MAATIRVLDNILADQIAAGEVVERPASVVKELLENAVDAGARSIQVSIEEGGKRLIRVTDDGMGMGREDASLCIVRHATSKLRSRDDLFAIRTLGFRGEALPSIGSVSRMAITTRRKEEEEGTRVTLAAGDGLEVAPTGCAPGTTVEVRDLFYNVPARLKFLKATATESGQVAGVCTRMAMAHPELRVRLDRDGRLAREYLPVGSFADRMAEIFPGEQLQTLELHVPPMQVTAVLGPPERARNGATALHLFVNGRPVKDIALARSIAFAYGSVIPPGRYPIGAVDLRLPPDEVDVNVHPQKSEVRIQDGRNRLTALTRALANALGTSAFRGPATRPKDYWENRLGPGPRIADREPTAAELFPVMPRPERVTGRPPASSPYTSDSPAPHAPEGRAPDWVTGPHPAVTEASAAPAQGPAAQGFFSSLRYLGQARRMLLICEGRQSLLVIDQHAADERVRYDRFRRAYEQRSVKTQQLLFPERVSCSESEAARVEALGEELSRVGLECSVLGPTTVAVHSIPSLLHRASPEQLLRDLLSELSGKGDRAFGDAIDMALATMACHAAIRAGDPLTAEEAQALLRSLDEVQDFGGHCPHGRPVAHEMPFADLERKLGR